MQPAPLPHPSTSEAGREPEHPIPDDPPLLLHATLEHIFISPGHDYYVKRGQFPLTHGIIDIPSALAVANRGLEGDRYFHKKPGHTGQVTFLQAETLDALQRHFNLPTLDPGLLRRNLVLRGADLKPLLRRRFLFQNVLFEGAQECKPCIWMDKVLIEGAQSFLKSPFHGGLRAQILSTGTLTRSL